MKKQKIFFLEKILKFLAERILKKYKPQIVAVAGSLGKTTTKEMAGDVLGSFKATRKTQKNFNNEISLPLTVIGCQNEVCSVFGWLAVFLKAFGLIIFPFKYPEILIIEMGADQPGDIEYLCSFVPVSVGILTDIGISHLEKFKTKSAIKKEKGYLLKQLPAQGLGVYNYDNKDVREIGEKIKANAISYGFEEGAQIRATDVLYGYEIKKDARGFEKRVVKGVSFKLNYQGKIMPVRLNHCIGKGQIYSALAVFSISLYFDLNLVKIAEILKNSYPAAGRMNLIEGIKNTMIIDDTYNSAPDSVIAALDAVKKINVTRKIAVLGDMLELGDKEDESH
nr:UDP-N-acetylmuramoyl-tripeptide--D-alanyl-D-alanine ligase [Patescibacteria group bacterium]